MPAKDIERVKKLLDHLNNMVKYQNETNDLAKTSATYKTMKFVLEYLESSDTVLLFNSHLDEIRQKNNEELKKYSFRASKRAEQYIRESFREALKILHDYKFISYERCGREFSGTAIDPGKFNKLLDFIRELNSFVSTEVIKISKIPDYPVKRITITIDDVAVFFDFCKKYGIKYWRPFIDFTSFSRDNHFEAIQIHRGRKEDTKTSDPIQEWRVKDWFWNKKTEKVSFSDVTVHKVPIKSSGETDYHKKRVDHLKRIAGLNQASSKKRIILISQKSPGNPLRTLDIDLKGNIFFEKLYREPKNNHASKKMPYRLRYMRRGLFYLVQDHLKHYNEIMHYRMEKRNIIYPLIYRNFPLFIGIEPSPCKSFLWKRFLRQMEDGENIEIFDQEFRDLIFSKLGKKQNWSDNELIKTLVPKKTLIGPIKSPNFALSPEDRFNLMHNIKQLDVNDFISTEEKQYLEKNFGLQKKQKIDISSLSCDTHRRAAKMYEAILDKKVRPKCESTKGLQTELGIHKIRFEEILHENYYFRGQISTLALYFLHFRYRILSFSRSNRVILSKEDYLKPTDEIHLGKILWTICHLYWHHPEKFTSFDEKFDRFGE